MIKILNKKNILTLIIILLSSITLVACGSDKKYENEPMPLSEGLGRNTIWLNVHEDFSRKSGIKNIFVFKDGNVNKYWLNSNITIEDIIELSDKEIIDLSINKSDPDPMYTHELGEYNLDLILDGSGNNTIATILETQKTKDAEEDITWADTPIFESIRFEDEVFRKQIFETTFSGFKISSNSVLISRIDNSFIGFKLDDPDTDKKGVTIEETRK